MTPATRKSRGYSPESADSIIPAVLATLVGLNPHRFQTSYRVLATTKAAALARLNEVGFYVSAPRILRVAFMDTMHCTAMHDAGWLREDGEVVVWNDGYGAEKMRGIVRIAPGSTEPELVGRWDWGYVRDDLDGPRQIVTYVTRLSDGARFPERRSDAPATPATGWDVEIEAGR